MENSGSGSDRRRRTRLAISQRASANATGTSLACEVRNHCRLGLYLLFAEPHDAQAAAAAWRTGTLVEVVFTATLHGQAHLVQILGTVVHMSAAGAGLAVPSMSQEAIQALQAASFPAAVLPVEAPVAGSDDHSEPASAIQTRCMTLFESALRGVFEEVFADVDAPFKHARDKSTDEIDRGQLREAPAAVRFGRNRIEKTFFLNAHEQQRLLRLQPACAPAKQSEDDLSLLEMSEFGDWLNLAAVVSWLESEEAYTPTLVLVEQRFGQLLGRQLDRRSNPFGPAMICRYLQQAVSDTLLNNNVRAVLYRAFGEVLQRHLPAMSEQLANALSAWSETLQERALEEPGTAPPTAQQAEAAPEGPISGVPSVDVPLRQSLLAVAQELHRPIDQARSVAVSAGTEAHATDGRWGSEAGLQNLLQLIDAMPQAGGLGLGGAGQTPFSMQLAKAAGGLHIPARAQRALDSAASLLIQAKKVSGGGAAIKALLQRLEQPLLKSALRDDGLLDEASHPARTVVDLLEQFAIAVDDDGQFLDPTLQRYLHKAVENVCRNADQDPAVYTRTRDSMSRLLARLRQTRQSRVSRLLEACEGQHRFRQARQRVDLALDARLGNLRVPNIVLSLLEGGWRQALVLLEFRTGEEGEQWNRELELLDDLIGLLLPDATASVNERRRAGLTASCRIEALLSSVNSDSEQRETLISDLQRALSEVISGQVRLQTVPYPTSGVAQSGDASAAGAGGQSPQASIQVRVGDWLHVQKDDAWLPMQLIWSSSTAQDYALTNRSATQHLQLTHSDLHRRLGEGTIKEWSDQTQPLVERSVQAMLDEGLEQVLQRSLRDPVSGLLSRKGFLQRLARVTTCRRSGHTHLLAIVEFDQFRVVSQACGVSQGDALARALSGEVRASLGDHGFVGSFRDDTLVVFLPDGRHEDGLARLNVLLEKLGDYRFQSGGHSFSIGVNIGVAEFTLGLLDAEAAVQQADMACVAAKTQGRNRLQCYEPESQMLRNQHDLLDWAGRIDSLLSGSGLHLRVQMVMPIAPDSGLQAYHEVLLGIELAPGRTLGPLPFVMALEDLRRAHELDLWVLHTVFDWIRNNRAAFAALGGFSINLSATSLAHAEIIETLRDYLLADDIPAEHISFEITETAAIQSYGAAADFIREMRRFGCRFALDDFGSGHTSYAHLKNLRADVLKIDGSFVKDIVDSPSDYAIVKSMNDIAHSLGMRTVAEYVESPAILAKLREIGVDYAQGYAIHKPCRIDEGLVRKATQHRPDHQPTTSGLDALVEAA